MWEAKNIGNGLLLNRWMSVRTGWGQFMSPSLFSGLPLVTVTHYLAALIAWVLDKHGEVQVSRAAGMSAVLVITEQKLPRWTSVSDIG